MNCFEERSENRREKKLCKLFGGIINGRCCRKVIGKVLNAFKNENSVKKSYVKEEMFFNQLHFLEIIFLYK